jgi:uroporphyrinogen decarboxylase
MNCRIRVAKTIKGEAVDRVPKGELLIDQEFIAQYFGLSPASPVPFQLQARLMEELQLDLISLLPPIKISGGDLTRPEELALVETDMKEVARWAKETGYFVFAVVGGGFQPAATYFDFLEIISLSHSNPVLAGKIFSRFAEINTLAALEALEAGADGIMIGDDIAYNQGTYFSPAVMRQILFPQLKKMVARIKETGKPVFFHADGNLNQVLPDLAELGIDGLHSLQPSAGMDIKEIKRAYGDRLCLMGNMDLDWLIPNGTQEEIGEAVRDTMTAAKAGGRYIFGTCGALSKGLPISRVKALYQAAQRWGCCVQET